VLAPRVALRYLRKRLVAYFAVLAVTLSVAAFYVIMGVLDGSRRRWEDVLCDTQPHILAHTPYIEGIARPDAAVILRCARRTPGVVTATPLLVRAAVVLARERRQVLRLHGIDLEAERKADTFARHFFTEPNREGAPRPPRVESLRATELETRLRERLREWSRPRGEEEDAPRGVDAPAEGGTRPVPGGVDDPPPPEPAPLPSSDSVPSPAPEPEFKVSPRGAVVGLASFEELKIKLGQVITLVHPHADSPRSMSFEVVGVFETGVTYLDTAVYVDLRAAQELFDMPGAVTGVAVWVEREHLLRPGPLRDRLAATLRADPALDRGLLSLGLWPPAGSERPEPKDEFLRLQTWAEMNREVVRMMAIQKWAMVIILGLLFILTAFLILAMLWVFVAEKVRDIGLLSALGASRGSVLAIFVLCGVTISALGTALGLGLGEIVCSNVNELSDFVLGRFAGVDLGPDLFGLKEGLPVHRSPVMILTVVALANGTALAASLIPAWRAARLDPVEALRHE